MGAGGDLGVALFFVLSGFLVSDLLFQRQTGIASVPEHGMRRIWLMESR